jgi:hypothetical protein
MSADLQKAFASSPYRCWQARMTRLSTGSAKGWLFASAKPVKGREDFLEIQEDLVFNKGCKTSLRYFREATRTCIVDVMFPRGSVIMKVFQLSNSDLATRREAQGLRLRTTEFKCEEHKRLASCDVEIKYLALFARLTETHVTPHMTIPICRSIVQYPEVERLLNGLGSKLLKGMKGASASRYMIMFAEKANYGSITDLVRKEFPKMRRRQLNYVLTCMIFQVVYTLACIHIRLPSFKHNDLHASNVLVGEINVKEVTAASPGTHYVRYTDEHGDHFCVDVSACPYRAMLWDMFYGSVNVADARRWGIGAMAPSKTRLGRNGSKRSRVVANQYYDLHKFLDSVEFLLRGSKQWDRLEAPLQKFFAQVLPETYKCASVGRPHAYTEKIHLHLIQHTTCRDLLRHPVFDSLRVSETWSDVAPLEAYNCRHGLDSKNPFPKQRDGVIEVFNAAPVK